MYTMLNSVSKYCIKNYNGKFPQFDNRTDYMLLVVSPPVIFEPYDFVVRNISIGEQNVPVHKWYTSLQNHRTIGVYSINFGMGGGNTEYYYYVAASSPKNRNPIKFDSFIFYGSRSYPEFSFMGPDDPQNRRPIINGTIDESDTNGLFFINGTMSMLMQMVTNKTAVVENPLTDFLWKFQVYIDGTCHDQKQVIQTTNLAAKTPVNRTTKTTLATKVTGTTKVTVTTKRSSSSTDLCRARKRF